MKTVLKIIVATIGTTIALNGIMLFFVSNLNTGNFLTVGLGVVMVLVALTFKKLSKWLKILLISGICIAIVFSSFLIIYGKNDTVTYREDAVIVLGAAVHGKTPSLTLKRRLDKAAQYHSKNPTAIIIVSGGQGFGEEITEAEAMKNYLISNGVNPDKIIKETKATSTYENFIFSKKLLDQKLNNNYTVTFITNEYHILRSSLCAKWAGLADVSYLHSNTNSFYLTSGSLRECLAVVKYIIFKK